MNIKDELFNFLADYAYSEVRGSSIESYGGHEVSMPTVSYGRDVPLKFQVFLGLRKLGLHNMANEALKKEFTWEDVEKTIDDLIKNNKGDENVGAGTGNSNT